MFVVMGWLDLTRLLKHLTRLLASVVWWWMNPNQTTQVKLKVFAVWWRLYLVAPGLWAYFRFECVFKLKLLDCLIGWMELTGLLKLKVVGHTSDSPVSSSSCFFLWLAEWSLTGIFYIMFAYSRSKHVLQALSWMEGQNGDWSYRCVGILKFWFLIWLF